MTSINKGEKLFTPNTALASKLKIYDFIRLDFVDLNGLHLSKIVPSRHAEKVAAGKCEVYAGMIAFGTRNEIVDHPEIVRRNHLNGLLRPDPDTVYACSWTTDENKYNRTRVCGVICDMAWPDGEVMGAYPRVVASKMLERLREKHKLQVFSAFEPEYRAFVQSSIEGSCKKAGKLSEKKIATPPIPFTRGTDMYKTNLLAVYEPLFLDIEDHMSRAGIDIQDFCNENGEGQLESPLLPSIGLPAADKYFNFKQILKEVATKHGMTISFMTSPMLDDSASGCHYNFSLRDAMTGVNAFFDPKDHIHLSSIARYWLAGILAHLPALTALCCPTVNCYRRLHRHLAPNVVNWEIDNRFTSVRVKINGVEGTYMENRLPSSASCPYHVMAATLAAGMDGLERKLSLPPAGMKPTDTGCVPLPYTLQEALQLLKGDTKLIEIIGEEFVDWFIRVKEKGDLVTLGKIDITDGSEETLSLERYQYLEHT